MDGAHLPYNIFIVGSVVGRDVGSVYWGSVGKVYARNDPYSENPPTDARSGRS